MPFPLAIVIPTYNRLDALPQCLLHLENQTRKDFEVVLVDDGSTDGTSAWIEDYRKRTPLSMRYLRQQNSGPSRARNAALALVEAPVTLLIGDDIFAAPNFVAVHMRLHAERPDESVVGLGLTRWAEQGQRVTRFMRWLETDGVQFNYGELLAGTPPDWRHFYTSNLSFKTALLRRFPFDETFPYAAMEDIELACRLEAAGSLHMSFLPEALAFHLHPITLAQACHRMEKVGEATAHFHTRFPDKVPFQPPSRVARTAHALVSLTRSKRLLEAVAHHSLRVACPNAVITQALRHRFLLGYRRHTRAGANLATQQPG